MSCRRKLRRTWYADGAATVILKFLYIMTQSAAAWKAAVRTEERAQGCARPENCRPAEDGKKGR